VAGTAAIASLAIWPNVLVIASPSVFAPTGFVPRV